jgi:CRP/FNR family cyclic AMP-dependent transcriptional regulator
MLRNEHTFPTNSFLGSISQESWNDLSKIWTTKQYKPNQFLIVAGDDEADVYFILRGSAHVTIYTASGREVMLVSIFAGDSFGEFSAIDNEPRSTSVVASDDCYAAVLTAKHFREFLKTHPDISFELLKVMVAHLRHLNQRVIDFNTKSANLRLQELLLSLAEKHCNGEDHVLVERPPTQTELAAYIFTSREGVAREMGRLRKAGILTREKRSIRFLSLKLLRKIIADNQ